MQRMNKTHHSVKKPSRWPLLAGLVLALASVQADARIKRSASEVREFRQANECPATGRAKGRCPGYEVDHIVALCLGGPDTVKNMQWLAVKTHKAKTRVDVKQCRINRRAVK